MKTALNERQSIPTAGRNDPAASIGNRHGSDCAERRPYRTPRVTRHGTLVELTFGEPIGQVETGGIIPNVFASTGTG